MDAKMEFVTRLRRGERMTDLCREFGIARKTGYEMRARFDADGAAGLTPRSRAPRARPHQTLPALAAVVVAARRAHPTWGPKKLKVVLEAQLGHVLPAASTIGGLLTQAGLVTPRRARPRRASPSAPLSTALAPNDLWCIDYKGQFRLGDQRYCYPLTMTDQHSRYLLLCAGMAAICEDAALDACIETFRQYGMPAAIRSDNGSPFASTGLAGLTALSAAWLRLGIRLERSRPGHPEDNGRHERMHRSLKRDTARPAQATLRLQCARFTTYRAEFNHVRPHEALAMRRPADVYVPSRRPYPPTLPTLDYPTYDDVLIVRPKGFVRFYGRREIYIGHALRGQPVGVREEADGRWLVSFAHLDLGHITPDRKFVPLGLPPTAST